uniref:Ovule protein n=1 Tax=Heterorhabditis bacteriophora TaxID=37862 RepID=A0A1I7WLH3_HETBA
MQTFVVVIYEKISWMLDRMVSETECPSRISACAGAFRFVHLLVVSMKYKAPYKCPVVVDDGHLIVHCSSRLDF